MVIDFGFGETVQLIRYEGAKRNAHGREIDSYADPVEVENVGVDVPKTGEPRDGTSQRATADIVLFFPHGWHLSEKDQVIVRGRKYEVEGEAPAITNFFTGDGFHTEVNVRRVRG